MAEDKEIQKQVKEGLADLKEATKQGVTSVNQEAKKAIADIKQQTKDSVAKATEQIDRKTEKSVQQIDKTTEKATQSVEKATAQSIKDINSTTKDSVKSINATTKDSSKNIETAAKNSVKDIVETTKDSINNINSTTKDNVKDIDRATKDGIENINITTKDNVKDIDSTAKDNIESIEEASVNSIKTINDASDTSVNKIDDTSEKQVEVIENKSAEQQQEIQQKVDDQANDAISKIKDVTQKVADEFKKRTEQLQDQLDEKLAGAEQKQADSSKDITTKLLQNILSEIKILRKVTEGSVSFSAKSGRYRDAKSGRYVKEDNVREQKDNKKEESEKDKKRKGFFTSIKDRFAKPKDDSKNKLTPVRQEGDGTQEKSSLFTNPLVLAGLLALVAPKEVLAFLKGFLGELLFGEESSMFLAGFIAFIAIWKSMKFVKALGSFLKILKPIAWIGRFLFMHPAIALIIGLVVGAYQLIKDFREKYGKRMERKALEDELKGLDQKVYEDTEEGKAERQKDEARKQEINKQLEEYSKQGIFTTQGQAREYALKNSTGKIDENKLSGQQKDGIDLIVKYDNAVERFKEKQKKLEPGENLNNDPDFQFVRDNGGIPPKGDSSSEIDPKARDRLFNDVGFKTPALKEQAENIIRKRRGLPTLESKPPATPAQSTQQSTNQGASQSSDAETASQNQRELNRAAAGSSTGNVGRSSDAVPATASSAPAPESKPTATSAAGVAPSTASSAPAPESKPTATSATGVAPSTSTPVATPDGTSQNQNLPTAPSQGVEEKPRLQPITPSAGETINNTSVAVDAEYQQPPEDTISVMNNNTTKIAKPSNAINSIPGIFADRSYFSQFEIFNNNQFSTLSSAGAGDG